MYQGRHMKVGGGGQDLCIFFYDVFGPLRMSFQVNKQPLVNKHVLPTLHRKVPTILFNVCFDKSSRLYTSQSKLHTIPIPIPLLWCQVLSQGFHSQNFCAIIRKSHFAQKLPYSAFANFKFYAIPQFRTKSETDCSIKVSTILVLDMHIS